MLDLTLDFQIAGSMIAPVLPSETEVVHALYRSFLQQFYELLRPGSMIIRKPSTDHALNTEWHASTGNCTEYMALWSNRHPSEVRLTDGSIVKGQPGDVILINNSKLVHRAPLEAVGDRSRWFLTTTCFTDARKIRIGVYPTLL